MNEQKMNQKIIELELRCDAFEEKLDDYLDQLEIDLLIEDPEITELLRYDD